MNLCCYIVVTTNCELFMQHMYMAINVHGNWHKMMIVYMYCILLLL